MKQYSNFITHFHPLSPKLIRFLSGLLLVVAPWISLFIVTVLVSHNSVLMLTPLWNDEISYWHEVLSFSSKGLNFGYYTINEILPAYLSFGTHGFGAISVYAAYAKIFGWNYNSIVIANNVFISIAFLFLLLSVKPTTGKTLLISVFYLTFTPLILYCSSSMTELMNFASLIIYFTLLYTLINSKTSKKKLFIVLLTFCFFISFIRIINIILFLPVIFYKKKTLKFDRNMVILLTGWVLLSILLFYVNSQFVSPYPYSFLSELFSNTNLSGFTFCFFKHLGLNLLRFIYPFRDDFLQVFQRYLIIYLILWFFIKSKVIYYRTAKIDILYFSSFIVLFLALVITFVAYDVFNWRDYRAIAPFIFGIILFLILSDQIIAIKRMLLINLFGLLFICFSPKIYNSFFIEKKRFIRPETNTVLNKIEYNKNAISKFENTLVINNFDENVFLNTPAGIGITYSDSISDKLKSKYIYIRKPKALKTYQIVFASKDGILYQKK